MSRVSAQAALATKPPGIKEQSKLRADAVSMTMKRCSNLKSQAARLSGLTFAPTAFQFLLLREAGFLPAL
ncbi:MAG: hypothetical protein AAB401_11880, partial [Acidobacteriota bacterium]